MIQRQCNVHPTVPGERLRSEDQLARRVAAFLSITAGLAASKTSLEVQQGRVVLRGTVTALQVKSQLEAHCCRVAGVLSVSNELRIAPSAEENPATLTRTVTRGGSGRAPAAVTILQQV